MSNLFSIFDPSALLGLPINWIATLITVLATPTLFWMTKSQLAVCFFMVVNFVNSEFRAVTGTYFTPGGTFICLNLFIFIALNNFFGLFSYVFTSSSHLTFTVALALPLWMGHMVYAWLLTPNNMLAHLVPLGTPYVLMPFMVLIETVSSIIRPLTLSVRLAANMVAGHLLLTLLSSQGAPAELTLLIPLFLSLILLGVLESAVALIQAYVFSVLSTLYVNEVNSSKL